jgi:hypothetical protein
LFHPLTIFGDFKECVSIDKEFITIYELTIALSWECSDTWEIGGHKLGRSQVLL